MMTDKYTIELTTITGSVPTAEAIRAVLEVGFPGYVISVTHNGG